MRTERGPASLLLRPRARGRASARLTPDAITTHLRPVLWSTCRNTGAFGAAQAARASRVEFLRGHQRKQRRRGILNPSLSIVRHLLGRPPRNLAIASAAPPAQREYGRKATSALSGPISQSRAWILTDARGGATFRTVRVSGHLAPPGPRAQSSATSAFEASVQQPAASAQVEPRDSRAAPQPNGRGVCVAARFPSLNDLIARPCARARWKELDQW
jgi:hypothetical protein